MQAFARCTEGCNDGGPLLGLFGVSRAAFLAAVAAAVDVVVCSVVVDDDAVQIQPEGFPCPGLMIFGGGIFVAVAAAAAGGIQPTFAALTQPLQVGCIARLVRFRAVSKKLVSNSHCILYVLLELLKEAV